MPKPVIQALTECPAFCMVDSYAGGVMGMRIKITRHESNGNQRTFQARTTGTKYMCVDAGERKRKRKWEKTRERERESKRTRESQRTRTVDPCERNEHLRPDGEGWVINNPRQVKDRMNWIYVTVSANGRKSERKAPRRGEREKERKREREREREESKGNPYKEKADPLLVTVCTLIRRVMTKSKSEKNELENVGWGEIERKKEKVAWARRKEKWTEKGSEMEWTWSVHNPIEKEREREKRLNVKWTVGKSTRVTYDLLRVPYKESYASDPWPDWADRIPRVAIILLGALAPLYCTLCLAIA